MTEKLFHVTNTEPLASGIYFDPEFSRLREPKNRFKVEKSAKIALEQSIERGKITVSCISGSNLALNSFGNGIGREW